MLRELDLKETLRLLEEHGWQPMMCDTKIDVYENTVSCGKPAPTGDTIRRRRLYANTHNFDVEGVYSVRARGDSMIDAEIDSGDLLTVETGVRIYPRDIVLASVDGEPLAKVYYEANDGTQWLLPFNRDYEPIEITDENEVNVMGRVFEITRSVPHISDADCERILERGRKKHTPQDLKLSREQLSGIIAQMGEKVVNSRQWFAVYRALVDDEQVVEKDYASFCELVCESSPQHPRLPKEGEMQRMATQSFSKCVALWRNDNAPVKGKRFEAYKLIAQRMTELLTELHQTA